MIQLKKENNYVTLLSDGTASFNYFNKHFNNADDSVNEAEYAAMKIKYDKVKEQIADKGNYKAGSSKYAISTDTIREYAYVMAKEEANVTWWLTRTNGTMATANATMYSELSSNARIQVKDLKTLLTALDATQQANLKSLYNFSDSTFEKAEAEGKEVMVILGTWDTNEYHFIDYVNAVKAYYGNDYVYYYKGHPKNPPQTIAGKMEKLAALGLIDVDATIPAELIMFFKPDVFVSGYASTTFVSVTDEKSCGLFNITKAAAAADSSISAYDENMDFFISTIDHSNTTYSSIVPNTSDTFYLIEAADSNTDFAVAIFNATQKTIKYYKIVEGSFVEVQR